MGSETPSVIGNVDALALAYRRMVGWFALQLVALAIVVVPIGDAAQSNPALGRARALLFTATVWASAVGVAYYAFRTARALGSSRGWVLAGLISLPYAFALMTSLFPDTTKTPAQVTQVMSMVGFFALLGLSAIATRECRAAGLSVGLLGPRRPKPPRS